MIKLIDILNEIKILGKITPEMVNDIYSELMRDESKNNERWDIKNKYHIKIQSSKDWEYIPQNTLNKLYYEFYNLLNNNQINEIKIINSKQAGLLGNRKFNEYILGKNTKESIYNFVKANPYVSELQIKNELNNHYSSKGINDNVRKVNLQRIQVINPLTKRKTFLYYV